MPERLSSHVCVSLHLKWVFLYGSDSAIVRMVTLCTVDPDELDVAHVIFLQYYVAVFCIYVTNSEFLAYIFTFYTDAFIQSDLYTQEC